MPLLSRARILASLSFTLTLALAASAPAQTPFDARQRELGARAAPEARRPEGVLPLLELLREQPFADPAITLAELERLARSSALPAPRRARAGAVLARARLRGGDVEG